MTTVNDVSAVQAPAVIEPSAVSVDRRHNSIVAIVTGASRSALHLTGARTLDAGYRPADRDRRGHLAAE